MLPEWGQKYAYLKVTVTLRGKLDPSAGQCQVHFIPDEKRFQNLSPMQWTERGFLVFQRLSDLSITHTHSNGADKLLGHCGGYFSMFCCRWAFCVLYECAGNWSLWVFYKLNLCLQFSVCSGSHCQEIHFGHRKLLLSQIQRPLPTATSPCCLMLSKICTQLP